MSQRGHIEFFFDYSSPFAYLGATQVERVAKDNDATVEWTPFLLGALFNSIGTANVPLFEMPAPKRAHASLDIHRWAAYHEVPFEFPSHFPMNTVKALRMTLQLQGADRVALASRVFSAYWAENKNINDTEQLASIASSSGFDGEALLEGCANPDVKLALRHTTERAEQVGVCGAPCFLVTPPDSEATYLFWGQDRLEFVAKVLGGWRPACG